MKIYTLVGKSGTGKSFHAVSYCEENNIESMIDDGLYIYKGIVLAGVSAKKSETKIGAIRMALFQNEEAKDAVVGEIKRKNPDSILILGTSDKMVDKIIVRLGLLTPDKLDEVKRVYIEDITTDDERNIARVERDIYGKHVVPAPEIQLKKNFAGYFMDPLKIIRGRRVKAKDERTVIRPPFSYHGAYVIEENVIDDIINLVAKETLGVIGVIYIGHISRPENYEIDITIKIDKNYDLFSIAETFQKNVYDTISYMTAFNVKEVDISVRSAE